MLFGRRFSIVLWLAFAAPQAFLPASCTAPHTVEGKVTKVADGDTHTLLTRDGTRLKMRLYGSDAPEIGHDGRQGQPYGEEAGCAREGRRSNPAPPWEFKREARSRKSGIRRPGDPGCGVRNAAGASNGTGEGDKP